MNNNNNGDEDDDNDLSLNVKLIIIVFIILSCLNFSLAVRRLPKPRIYTIRRFSHAVLVYPSGDCVSFHALNLPFILFV